MVLLYLGATSCFEKKAHTFQSELPFELNAFTTVNKEIVLTVDELAHMYYEEHKQIAEDLSTSIGYTTELLEIGDIKEWEGQSGQLRESYNAHLNWEFFW